MINHDLIWASVISSIPPTMTVVVSYFATHRKLKKIETNTNGNQEQLIKEIGKLRTERVETAVQTEADKVTAREARIEEEKT